MSKTLPKIERYSVLGDYQLGKSAYPFEDSRLMTSKQRIRIRIAQEAAKIIVEEGINDYFFAKQKAATRLGLDRHSLLPRKDEIDLALAEHHRLFRSVTQKHHIQRLRILAIEAMQFLEYFSPKLVGGVLDGNAGDYSPIVIHLFTHSPEEVLIKLLDAGIPFTEESHDILIENGTMSSRPAFHFLVNHTKIELKLFPPHFLNQSIKSKGILTEKASIKALRLLINKD